MRALPDSRVVVSVITSLLYGCSADPSPTTAGDLGGNATEGAGGKAATGGAGGSATGGSGGENATGGGAGTSAGGSAGKGGSAGGSGSAGAGGSGGALPRTVGACENLPAPNVWENITPSASHPEKWCSRGDTTCTPQQTISTYGAHDLEADPTVSGKIYLGTDTLGLWKTV